ncbi:hypothetical protein AB1Y20_010304 [Prymnesium parvum]|uniref:Poly A polymerase head domain-containing protein n=1 Tax=Prymnesium parvum TaxID=97485 RepID=A0AB34K6T7_PRYPA
MIRLAALHAALALSFPPRPPLRSPSHATRLPPKEPPPLFPSFPFRSPPRPAHRHLLPPLTRALIPRADKLVLSFILQYLEHHRLHHIGVYVSGGYVRDLLLGRPSQDLDLSLCLRDAAPSTTIETVVAGMPAFAAMRPELGVSSVELIGQLSKAAQGKSMDSAQVRMAVFDTVATVDFMPTIGDEVYDETDRIPHRDVRGTPQQDALRRDLTIGAMLLHVTRGEARREVRLWGSTPATRRDDATQEAAEAAAAELQFRLLDFQGGLADLHDRVLRSPYPRDRSLADVWTNVIVGSYVQPQRQRQLNKLLLAGHRVATAASARGTGWRLDDRAGDEPMLQLVWWIKCLRDDPLRLVRAMRFAATLDFEVHSTFWLAVPFAVEALRTKVAGPRKMAELYKVAKAGRPALLAFFELTFQPLAAFGDDIMFGDALFGGPSCNCTRLSVTQGFNSTKMREAAASLPLHISADGAIGAVLAAAVLSSDLKACASAAPPPALHSVPAADLPAAAAAALSLAEVRRACDGLCAPARMRAAAAAPLEQLLRLLGAPPPQGQHAALAAALRRAPLRRGVAAEDASAAGVAALLRMWELLRLEPRLPAAEVGPEFTLGLARARCSPATSDALARRLRLLSAAGPQLSGRAVAGLEEVPAHLRAQLLAQLHVLGRLRGDTSTLETAEELREWVQAHFGDLLLELEAEWCEWVGGERRVREEYTARASQAWLRE